MSDLQVANALLHEDLSSFIQMTFGTVSSGEQYLHNWHVDAIAHALTRCVAGEVTRLIITMPPRYLKSVCATIAFPAWLLGRDPHKRIITVSYADKLIVEHSNMFRSVVKSEWYRDVFPNTDIHPKKDTETDVRFTAGGYRSATTVGGTLTGRGADFIIVDDAMKAEDGSSEAVRTRTNSWFDSTLLSRLNNKKAGVIIVIMQRLHPEDLVGHLLKQGGWEHLNLPAIALRSEKIAISPLLFKRRKAGTAIHRARESVTDLKRQKNQMGSYNFAAQYQQAPTSAKGNLIKWKWFKTYEELPHDSKITVRIWSWDTASKASELNNYSVGTLWYVSSDRYYLVRIVRRRLDFPHLKKVVVDCMSSEPRASLLIEDKGSGTQLIQDLRHEGLANPIAIEPVADKITRMSAHSTKIEAGQVFLPRTASWLPDFKEEVLAFPHGPFDDQVDSFSQFLGKASELTKVQDWNIY